METLTSHPYLSRLHYEEKTILSNKTKNMVKPRNNLLQLKDHNVESSEVTKTEKKYLLTLIDSMQSV